MNIVIRETTAGKAQIGGWPRISDPFQIIKPITFVTFLIYLPYHIGSRLPAFRAIFDVGGNVGNIHFQIQRGQRRGRIRIFYWQRILIHVLVARVRQIILHLLNGFRHRLFLLACSFLLLVPLGEAVLPPLEFVTILSRARIILRVVRHLPAYGERALVRILHNFLRDHGILYLGEAKIRLFQVRVARALSPPIVRHVRLRGLGRRFLALDPHRRAHLGGMVSRYIGERVRIRVDVHVRAGWGAHGIFHLHVQHATYLGTVRDERRVAIARARFAIALLVAILAFRERARLETITLLLRLPTVAHANARGSRRDAPRRLLLVARLITSAFQVFDAWRQLPYIFSLVRENVI